MLLATRFLRVAMLAAADPGVEDVLRLLLAERDMRLQRLGRAGLLLMDVKSDVALRGYSVHSFIRLPVYHHL
jgi:hypothetical protein